MTEREGNDIESSYKPPSTLWWYKIGVHLTSCYIEWAIKVGTSLFLP